MNEWESSLLIFYSDFIFFLLLDIITNNFQLFVTVSNFKLHDDFIFFVETSFQGKDIYN